MCARSCVLVVHIRICLLSRLICIFIQHDDDDDGCLFISAYFLMSVLESASSRVTMTRMSCGMLDVCINVCVCVRALKFWAASTRSPNQYNERRKKNNFVFRRFNWKSENNVLPARCDRLLSVIFCICLVLASARLWHAVIAIDQRKKTNKTTNE